MKYGKMKKVFAAMLCAASDETQSESQGQADNALEFKISSQLWPGWFIGLHSVSSV
ncbi:MAG: hypothetical protein MR355_06160 [Lachnospiraceae bacterium]|nr:hypothetical protein [Lachnospiraceae bacterium]